MKHILSTVTVLFILLTSSVSWGSVDGKGIECKKYNGDTVRFSFNDKKVLKYGFKVIEDKVEITTLYKEHYDLTNSYIYWGSYTFNYTLNRKTLKLSITDPNNNEKTYHCEVYSYEVLIKNLREMVEQFQSEYDKNTKDNKI